jgi:peptide/nickel transport system ATP-binding protein
MIFQEPNAALNPIMPIGEQIGESFLFHRKKEMIAKILEDLCAPECGVLYPLKRFQQILYRLAAQNPDAFFLKVFDRVPILKRWHRRLEKEAGRRAVEILGKLGIPAPERIVKQYPHHLSGGMKQRIVIAIALACNPLLLIADEATSNLDVTIQAQILELLSRLKKRAISSILLITHDLGVVAETCDRVGVMYAGNLCEVADVRDLFEAPLHPYTTALLDAVPKFSTEGMLESIEGNVPNLVSPPPGCRFHPRCPHAMDICRSVLPELIDFGDNRVAACHWVERKFV